MDWSFLTTFLTADKVGGYTRGIVAAEFGMAIAKWPVVAQYVDGTTQSLIAGAVAGIAVGIWSHIAKNIADKSTPRTPIGMKAGGPIGAAIIGLFLVYGGGAHAQTVTPLPVKAPPVAVPVAGCSQLSCTGFFAGGSIYGIGGNAAILQNGVAGSIFAGGGDIGLNAGWQYWDSKYFVSFDADAMIESTNNAGVNNFAGGGFVGILHAKLGGNLLGLVANGPAPITPPSALVGVIMASYIDNCVAFRKNGSQYCGGAGTQFWLAPKLTLDLLYDYAPPSDKVNALQNVGAKVSYHF